MNPLIEQRKATPLFLTALVLVLFDCADSSTEPPRPRRHSDRLDPTGDAI